MKKIFTSFLMIIAVMALVSCEFAAKKSFKIIFDTDGGSEIEEITIAKGAEIVLPDDPVKEGFTFGGWYIDIDLTEAFEMETMPSETITLYAKWLVKLTFDANGGQNVGASEIVGEPGSVFALPADPVYGENIFTGWYYEDGSRLTYVMPRRNETVKAKWEVLEEGSALVLENDWLINDEGSYIVNQVEEGTKITATSAKGEWSFVFQVMDGNLKSNKTVIAVLQGMEGVSAVLKVEGGNAEMAAETSVTFTGEEQRVVWTVEEKNLTSNGGQKFLIFINGGTVGCGEEPEWVIVKSVGLYHTLEEGEEQKALLSFMTNGGTEIDPYYLAPGTQISAPADPEKGGFVFKGWFADKDLTIPYEFSVMPDHATIVYAKWELENECLPDCNLMGGQFTGLDEGAYEIQNNENSYVLKKTAEGGAWTCMVLPMTGKSLAGYNLLRVEIQGPAGSQILFKINDENAGERYVTCTGEKQTLELSFDLELNPAKSLVVFLAPGVEGESGVFTITALAYGNYSRYLNLLVEGWYDNDQRSSEEEIDPTYNIALEDGVLTYSKKAELTGKEWSVIMFNVEGLSLQGFDHVVGKIQGPAGEQAIVKFNDAIEQWITCTGEPQSFQIDIPAAYEYNMQKPIMVLFANPGANGSGNAFVITEFAVLRDEEKNDEPVEIKNEYDLLEGLDVTKLGNIGEGLYNVAFENDVLTLSKKLTGGEWNCLILPAMPELDGRMGKKLVITYVGPADEAIMFKFNDSKEIWQTATGQSTTIEIDLTDFVINGSKGIMVLFVNPGAAGDEAEFAISKMQLILEPVEEGEEEKDVDLMGGQFAALDAGTYEIENNAASYVLKKTANGGEWQCMVLPMTGKELAGMNLLRVELQGPAGEEIMFKINDEGAGERKVLCTGEKQYLELAFDLTLDPSKSLVVFLKPGVAGESGEFKITRLEYSNHAEIINVLGYSFEALDEGMYEIVQENGTLTVTKNATGGEWNCIVVKPKAELAGAKTYKLVADVKGTEGEQILLKLNDTYEKWVTCTGAVQHLVFDLEATLDGGKNLFVIFANGGAAGSGNPFEITKLELVLFPEVVEVVPVEPKSVNMIPSQLPQLTDHDIEVLADGAIAVNKNANGGEWSNIMLPTEGKELEGLNLLRVEFIGPAGDQIMFKVNNVNAGEQWITCTGYRQFLELKFDLELDAAAGLPVFFAPGVAGASGVYKIYKVEFSNYQRYVELVNAEFTQDNPGHTIDQSATGLLKFTKFGGEWDCIYTASDAYVGEHVVGMYVIVEGTEGEQVLVKLNDSLEKWVTCTGAVQEELYEIDHTMSSNSKVMVLFGNPGIQGTQHEFVISSLVLILE